MKGTSKTIARKMKEKKPGKWLVGKNDEKLQAGCRAENERKTAQNIS